MKQHLTEKQLIKYLFKLASEKRAKETTAHLEKCPSCRLRLEQIKQKFAPLELLQEEAEASEQLISQTLSRIKQKPTAKTHYFRSPAWMGTAAAAAIILIATLIFLPSLRKTTMQEQPLEIADAPQTAPAEETFALADKPRDDLRRMGKDEEIPEMKQPLKMADSLVREKVVALPKPQKPPFAPAGNIELVTLPRRENVQLTIYNSADLTLVREQRNLTMKIGWNWLQFMWAETLIDPTSLHLQPRKHADKFHVEQLVFPPRLRELGRWLINSQVSGQIPVEITYFTSGLAWRAFYMGTLSTDEKTMTLQGYVRVTNNSGEDYQNAQTRLLVGKVNLLDRIGALARRDYPYGRQAEIISSDLVEEEFKMFQWEDKYERLGGYEYGMMGGMGGRPKEITKEGLGEYFLYTIEGTETIPNGWGKRLPSFAVADIPVKSLYKYDEEQWADKTIRFVSFANDQDHRLGQTPIPNGNIKIYRRVNEEGNLSYVGGSNIKYIPVNEKVQLNLGAARLVSVEPVLANFKTDNYVFDSKRNIAGWDEVRSWKVEITNTRRLPVDLEITRGFKTPYWTLQMNDGQEVSYEKHDATHARFKTTLQPQSKRTFTYTVTTYHEKRQESFIE